MPLTATGTAAHLLRVRHTHTHTLLLSNTHWTADSKVAQWEPLHEAEI